MCWETHRIWLDILEFMLGSFVLVIVHVYASGGSVRTLSQLFNFSPLFCQSTHTPVVCILHPISCRDISLCTHTMDRIMYLHRDRALLCIEQTILLSRHT